MYDKKLVVSILEQIKNSLDIILSRFLVIKTIEDFTNTPQGIEKLDSICMQLINVGESLKNIDKITNKQLLDKYEGINWKGIKGLRDIITHHYFDIDAEEIFWICSKELIPLKNKISLIIDDLI